MSILKEGYMPYIAFFDMIGTRNSALISSEEYKEAINDFNNTLEPIVQSYSCQIYGYSDSVYAEIKKTKDLIPFFRTLRDKLMENHRYFSAAVDCGSLGAKKTSFDENKGFSMEFTKKSTIDIYLKQCQFSGIGVWLSESVVSILKQEKMEKDFCQSVYQRYPAKDIESGIVQIYDISYDEVSLDKLKYIISDYLMTAATSERAGRYYITAIISMIKGLDKNVVLYELKKAIDLLSLNSIPYAFKSNPQTEMYSVYFMFALIDYILLLRNSDEPIDYEKMCKTVISEYKIEQCKMIKTLSTIPTAIISEENKRNFLKILYNMSAKID